MGRHREREHPLTGCRESQSYYPARNRGGMALLLPLCYASFQKETLMITREPATPEQRSELSQSLDRMQLECEALLDLVRTMYGAEDHRTLRAEELCHDLQRLRWALERGDSSASISLLKQVGTVDQNQI